jgi:hypothetical protein
MSLKDLMAEHARTVFLNREHFGETAVYQENGQEPREVNGVGQYAKPEDLKRPEEDDEQEELWWYCLRDDAAGGIAAPELGATLLRPDDSEDSPWTFQGQVRNASDESWELLFARNRPRRYGLQP